MAASLPTPFKWMDGRMRKQCSPTVRKDKIHDPLRNLNVHKSMGFSEVHSRVLRKSAAIYLSSVSCRQWKKSPRMAYLFESKRSLITLKGVLFFNLPFLLYLYNLWTGMIASEVKQT